MTGKIEVVIDKAAVIGKIQVRNEKLRTIVANELLKDANYYCKQDSGELIRSSIRASKPEEGLLIWDTPYAKKQYYTGTASKDTNPNATIMWAHKAKDENKEKYERMMNKEV